MLAPEADRPHGHGSPVAGTKVIPCRSLRGQVPGDVVLPWSGLTWEPGAVPDFELPLFTDKDRLFEVRTAMLDEAVRPWRRRYPEVAVRVSLLLERPREALLAAAADADLLVVGDRGAGGLDPLLLGATSSAMHAPCPRVRWRSCRSPGPPPDQRGLVPTTT